MKRLVCSGTTPKSNNSNSLRRVVLFSEELIFFPWFEVSIRKVPYSWLWKCADHTVIQTAGILLFHFGIYVLARGHKEYTFWAQSYTSAYNQDKGRISNAFSLSSSAHCSSYKYISMNPLHLAISSCGSSQLYQSNCDTPYWYRTIAVHVSALRLGQLYGISCRVVKRREH